MDKDIKDNSQSVTENEVEETTEQVNTEETPNDDKDYKQLYENQKIRAEKAEKQLKDLPKDEQKSEKSSDNNRSDNTLLEKAFLRTAQITEQDEVELALETAKKWGVGIDELVDDEDFQIKLKKVRDIKANALATSNMKGGNSTQSAKETPEYWIKKGVPPTANDVSDDSKRRKISRELLKSRGTSSSKVQFYNS